MLTIKELTQTVGQGTTPRMVRYYHQIGLLPQPRRSPSNYRLYNESDIQRLRQIVALKQQGFQISHIKQILAAQPVANHPDPLLDQLQQQYQSVLQQLTKLRHTATALEGLIGRDQDCQFAQAEALSQLRQLTAGNETANSLFNPLLQQIDTTVPDHPEHFQQSLTRLLPDLFSRPEIEVDVLSHLVLACGDVSLTTFVRFSTDAIKAAREALSTGCTVVGDVPALIAAFDQPRLAHLGCQWETLINSAHIDSAADAEHTFWKGTHWHERLTALIDGNIWVVGYAPSVLMKLCEAIKTHASRPALVIGLPAGFSHATTAKRRLMQLQVPYITTDCALGGGLLASVVLNRLAASLIEKPDCHCYLTAALSHDNNSQT